MKIALAGSEERLKNYIAALDGLGLESLATLAPENTDDCAGLLLPGGGDVDPALYGERCSGSTGIDRGLDNVQLAMADRFIRAGKPVLGICRGQQLLNVYFGGGLIQDLAVAETHRWNNGDRFHPCRSFPGSVIYTLYGSDFTVNSAHHQALGRMGTDLRVTAAAPDGTAEAMEHRSLPILGVQWHPERLTGDHFRPDAADGAKIFEYFKRLL